MFTYVQFQNYFRWSWFHLFRSLWKVLPDFLKTAFSPLFASIRSIPCPTLAWWCIVGWPVEDLLENSDVKTSEMKQAADSWEAFMMFHAYICFFLKQYLSKLHKFDPWKVHTMIWLSAFQWRGLGLVAAKPQIVCCCESDCHTGGPSTKELNSRCIIFACKKQTCFQGTFIVEKAEPTHHILVVLLLFDSIVKASSSYTWTGYHVVNIESRWIMLTLIWIHSIEIYIGMLLLLLNTTVCL